MNESTKEVTGQGDGLLASFSMTIKNAHGEIVARKRRR
jgi:hypothetical protein